MSAVLKDQQFMNVFDGLVEQYTNTFMHFGNNQPNY